MVKLLNNINHEYDHHIQQTTSSSRVSGFQLRQAHYLLGRALSKQIQVDGFSHSQKYLIIIKMRSGLCFGMGIADELESLGYIVHVKFEGNEPIEYNQQYYAKIIIVDGVINTGKTILRNIAICEVKKAIIATNVISAQAVDLLNDYNVYATRISQKNYAGAQVQEVRDHVGPDTSDRLFNSDFFDQSISSKENIKISS